MKEGVSLEMATDDPRCKFCIYGEGFWKLTPVGDFLKCDRCGHVEWPFNPKFICECKNCGKIKPPPITSKRERYDLAS